MDGGWVKLHRKLLKSDVAGDHVGWAVWTWCLVKANWESRKWRGKVIEAGQFVTGRKAAADELGLSEYVWYRAIKRLEKYGYIRTESAQKGTLVTVCNWATYQEDSNDSAQKAHSERTASAQQAHTKEEVKKERSTTTCGIQEFFNRWNELAKSKSRLKVAMRLTKKREEKIRARLKDPKWFDDFRSACRLIPLGGSGWQPTLDWLIHNEHNVYRILEGEFDWRMSDDPAMKKLHDTKRKKEALRREERLEQERSQAKCLSRQTSEAMRSILPRQDGEDESQNASGWLFGQENDGPSANGAGRPAGESTPTT